MWTTRPWEDGADALKHAMRLVRLLTVAFISIVRFVYQGEAVAVAGIFQVVSLLDTGTAVRDTQWWGCGHVGVVRVASDVLLIRTYK